MVSTEVEGRPNARERIVTSAYSLFATRGVRGVGVDELIRTAEVSTATFYRHFRSKHDLVIAFLERREQVWTIGLIESGAKERGNTPRQQLLGIFDVFDDWFQRDDYEACSFINVLLEMGPQHPLGKASIGYLDRIRQMIRGIAEGARLRDLDDFVWSWHILMKGSIVSAAEGDLGAARRARRMGAIMIEEFSDPAFDRTTDAATRADPAA